MKAQTADRDVIDKIIGSVKAVYFIILVTYSIL